MSRISRGTPLLKRKNAKNYTQNEAQKRLNETVASFNRQTVNALFVDSVEVDYYQVQDETGYPCSCEKTESMPQYNQINNNVPPVVPTQKKDSSEGIRIRLKENDLFGERAERIMDSMSIDVSGHDDHPHSPRNLLSEIDAKNSGNVDYENGVFFGSNVQCGICYRAGFQPGYKAWGKQRHVLTHKDIENVLNYWTNTTKAPHTICKQVDVKESFVEFKIVVPRYFSHIIYSIRNNEKTIEREYLYSDKNIQLKLSDFVECAGKEIVFRVRAPEFTHVVIEFDIGNQKLFVNVSTESQTLDYSLLETIGNMSVVIPPTVHEVKPNDVLVLKKRRLALKIIDKERKITSDQRRLEWMVQTRVLQATEGLKYIADGFKML